MSIRAKRGTTSQISAAAAAAQLKAGELIYNTTTQKFGIATATNTYVMQQDGSDTVVPTRIISAILRTPLYGAYGLPISDDHLNGKTLPLTGNGAYTEAIINDSQEKLKVPDVPLGKHFDYSASFFTIFTGNIPYKIAYGAGIFVAVGAGGKMATSPDGMTWTSVTSSFSTTVIYDVCYNTSNQRWYACGAGGKIGISSNNTASTWAQVTTTNASSSDLYCIKTNAASSYVIAAGAAGRCVFATNANSPTTWTAITTAPTAFGANIIRAIINANNRFIIIGDGGRIFYSATGNPTASITWTQRSAGLTSNSLTSIVEANMFQDSLQNSTINNSSYLYISGAAGTVLTVLTSSISGSTGLAAHPSPNPFGNVAVNLITVGSSYVLGFGGNGTIARIRGMSDVWDAMYIHSLNSAINSVAYGLCTVNGRANTPVLVFCEGSSRAAVSYPSFGYDETTNLRKPLELPDNFLVSNLYR